MKKILLLIICTFTTSLSWGDSPLTYTEFHKAYIDVPIVQSALSSKGSISSIGNVSGIFIKSWRLVSNNLI